MQVALTLPKKTPTCKQIITLNYYMVRQFVRTFFDRMQMEELGFMMTTPNHISKLQTCLSANPTSH